MHIRTLVVNRTRAVLNGIDVTRYIPDHITAEFKVENLTIRPGEQHRVGGSGVVIENKIGFLCIGGYPILEEWEHGPETIEVELEIDPVPSPAPSPAPAPAPRPQQQPPRVRRKVRRVLHPGSSFVRSSRVHRALLLSPSPPRAPPPPTPTPTPPSRPPLL